MKDIGIIVGGLFLVCLICLALTFTFLTALIDIKQQAVDRGHGARHKNGDFYWKALDKENKNP